MSYTKIVATPLTLAYVSFVYSHATMLPRIKEETQYKARMVPDRFDELAFSDDESDVFDRYIKDAIYAVGEKLNNLNDGLVLSGTGAIYVTSTEVGVCVIDHSVYNDNILTLVDRSAELAIQAFILKKWWEKCGMVDDYKIQDMELSKQLYLLSEHIWEMRIPDIDSTPATHGGDGTATAKTEVVIVTGIAALTPVRVAHTFGSSMYFVQAILPDGTNVPGFDSLITTRDVDAFEFISGYAYASVTFVLFGAIS